ncbi:MAG: hypothetical protein DRO07_02575 [Candidatus Iainarchaeum archaeon]|uniref:Uncharacterized protein n=1 Tax=Candidatus Iainarchaeum sp. TaxID=3101447 RepID=A0A497JF35_9ARCH|nr:MAG: hypothetical protein DRO07_02575 [Candidatus Diapherotrites archaeon]
MPRKSKKSEIPKRYRKEREKVLDTLARFYAPPTPKAIGRLMLRSRKIASAQKPLAWKAREFARTAFLIKRGAERGIIPTHMAIKLRKALQSRASETIQKEASMLAKKGIIDQKFLNALEEMVEKGALKPESATNIAKEYLGVTLSNLKLAPLRKPIRWKLRVLKRIKEIVEIEAELRGFSKRTKNARLRELKERVFEIIEAEVVKIKPKIDLGMFNIIESLAREELITEAQAKELSAIFIENSLNAIKNGKTSSVGLGNLEVKIWGLPQKERSKLLTLLNEVKASFRKH